VAGKLTLEFAHRYPAAVNYRVEASYDLFSWETIATLSPGDARWTLQNGVLMTETVNSTDSRRVTITDWVNLSQSPKRFLRLRVTTP
jgi:hypothetical protein